MTDLKTLRDKLNGSLMMAPDENEEMLYVIVNKYEVNHLKRIIHSYDPKAFIVANSGVNVDGHFLKHLS